jgi:molecular chaperone DnaK
MEGSDVASLTSATERLSQAAMKIGEHVYKAEAAAAASAAPGAAPADNVVDAEFEELDENKKKSA